MSKCEWLGVLISIPWFLGMVLIALLLFFKENKMLYGIKVIFYFMKYGSMLFFTIGCFLQLFGEYVGQFYFEMIGFSKIGTSLWSTSLVFSMLFILFKKLPDLHHDE